MYPVASCLFFFYCLLRRVLRTTLTGLTFLSSCLFLSCAGMTCDHMPSTLCFHTANLQRNSLLQPESLYRETPHQMPACRGLTAHHMLASRGQLKKNHSELLFAMMQTFQEQTLGVVAQQCKRTQHCWPKHLKVAEMVNFMVCGFIFFHSRQKKTEVQTNPPQIPMSGYEKDLLLDMVMVMHTQHPRLEKLRQEDCWFDLEWHRKTLLPTRAGGMCCL